MKKAKLIGIYLIKLLNILMLFIAKSDIGQFWEECKSYFSTEQNRKSGDILLSMINQKN